MDLSKSRLNALILFHLRGRGGKSLSILKLLEEVRTEYRETYGSAVDSISSWGERGAVGYAASSATVSRQPATVLSESNGYRYPLELTPGPFLRRIQTLHDLGFLIVGRRGFFRRDELKRMVALSPNFIEMQTELGISLTDIRERDNNTISITPSFGPVMNVQADVFVIMPFSSDLEATYSAIQSVCEDLKLKAIRGNELFEARHVITDVWSAIFCSKAIVCDCTDRNPNVFYELGIAHTLGKKVVLISRNEADIPFDLRHWRYMPYAQPDAAFCANLRLSLDRIISAETEIRRPRVRRESSISEASEASTPRGSGRREWSR